MNNKMEKERLVPELRFPSFEGEWSETAMGELMTFKNGYNAAKEQYGSGRKFINVLDIIENDFITHDTIIGSVEIPEKDFEKNKVEHGDILFQRSSETREEVGQANVYLDKDKPATFGGFVIRGKPTQKYDPVYFNELLKSAKARKDITSRSGGSTRYNIGQESLEAVKINISPTFPEQQKVAGFLTAVDGRIGQLIQKRALLEDYKKGVMRQLFTQATRFKDYNGNDFPDWEEKKLGEISSLITSGSRNWAQHYSESGSKFVRMTNLTRNGIGLLLENMKYVSLPLSGSEGARTSLDHNDILISITAELGKIGWIPDGFGEAFINQHTALVRPRSTSANSRFIAYCLSSAAMNKRINRLNDSGAKSGLNLSTIRSISLAVPSLPEQTKIANVLSAIDRKIERVATQITETQTFKRGLLQQMFV